MGSGCRARDGETRRVGGDIRQRRDDPRVGRPRRLDGRVHRGQLVDRVRAPRRRVGPDQRGLSGRRVRRAYVDRRRQGGPAARDRLDEVLHPQSRPVRDDGRRSDLRVQS